MQTKEMKKLNLSEFFMKLFRRQIFIQIGRAHV